MKLLVIVVSFIPFVEAFIPLIDGGTDIPQTLGYKSWFNDQLSKQASTAVQKAIAAGNQKLEVNFPPVPNVEEVRFGTALNKKFGESIVAKELQVAGGYQPGSDISRNLIAYSNVYWAKKLASAVGGGLLGGRPVSAVSSERVNYKQLKSLGGIAQIGSLQRNPEPQFQKRGPLIAINPGGEETWDRIQTSYGSASPLVVLNNAYSTTYGLGNQRDYEEAYYLKRISKGWIFRTFPGPWQAYLEKPDGSCELLETYLSKPELNQVAKTVREESFKRYAINNDRWMAGRL